MHKSCTYVHYIKQNEGCNGNFITIDHTYDNLENHKKLVAVESSFFSAIFFSVPRPKLPNS